jgi:hypothetical protein
MHEKADESWYIQCPNLRERERERERGFGGVVRATKVLRG